MGREETLLQRIARWGGESNLRPVGPPSTQEDLDALIESVRWHLERVINSRHGMSEALEDYGLPCLNELVAGNRENVRIVQTAIAKAVEKYEPRLQRVQVKALQSEDGPRKLAFRIEGMLISRGSGHRVYFDTKLGGDGQFEVMD